MEREEELNRKPMNKTANSVEAEVSSETHTRDIDQELSDQDVEQSHKVGIVGTRISAFGPDENGTFSI